jgi:hypothetical protein
LGASSGAAGKSSGKSGAQFGHMGAADGARLGAQYGHLGGRPKERQPDQPRNSKIEKLSAELQPSKTEHKAATVRRLPQHEISFRLRLALD